MQISFIKNDHTELLNLFFLGYGQDAGVLRELLLKAPSDVAVVYDFRNFEFDESLFRDYERISLMTWSMGVSIAPHILRDSSLLKKIVSAYAINGTLEGIDDKLGIPLKMWNATIDAMSESSALKFFRRMCSSSEIYDNYMSHREGVDVPALKDELVSIRDFILNKGTGFFAYNHAYISAKDRIMSAENQKASWEKHEIDHEVIENSHYCPEVFADILK